MILVFFHRDRTVSRLESPMHARHYLTGESAAFTEPLVTAMVMEGVATCAPLKRIRFVAPATIAAPSAFAGIYVASDQLYVMDAATAAALIAGGEAVEAPPA